MMAPPRRGAVALSQHGDAPAGCGAKREIVPATGRDPQQSARPASPAL
jgi:hypothetical protein